MGFKFRDVATFVLVALLFYFALTAQGENTSLEEDLLDQDDIYRTPHFYNDYDNYRDHYQVESDTPRPPYFMQRQNKTENTEYTEQPEGSAGREEQDSGTDADDCWLKLNAAEFFETMDNLDKEFEEVRRDYQLNVGESMDSQMMDELLSSRGAAHRAVHKAGGDSNQIPAGLNLGGYSMMRLEDSILFFHRMKLRNSTNFQVQYLHNDLKNMALIARIDLHDLHLLGSYERSATHKDPSTLYYTPSYGALELLLKNVDYKMQARLRMMSDRVTIELINSELVVNDGILMTYNRNITNVPDPTVKVATLSLEDFLQRLKTDLDLWLKDYFNDYLMYFQLPDYDNSQFQEYENKKTILLNKFVHNAVNTIKKKIFNLGGHALKLPKFTIFSVPNMILKIENGVLRGMDSMYQRSVGTGMKNKTVRSVDVIVGFSRLRVEYKFETILPDGSPPLSGYLMMSADEMTAHMGISMVKDPESVDLNFDFIQQMKPESLTVEGPANRLIANFKHNLEYNIIAMMSNALMHNIKMLNTITRCVPFFYGHTDDGPNELPNEDEDINNL